MLAFDRREHMADERRERKSESRVGFGRTFRTAHAQPEKYGRNVYRYGAAYLPRSGKHVEFKSGVRIRRDDCGRVHLSRRRRDFSAGREYQAFASLRQKFRIFFRGSVSCRLLCRAVRERRAGKRRGYFGEALLREQPRIRQMQPVERRGRTRVARNLPEAV